MLYRSEKMTSKYFNSGKKFDIEASYDVPIGSQRVISSSTKPETDKLRLPVDSLHLDGQGKWDIL